MIGFDPNVTVDEQAHLLPYKEKYEFPRCQLELGKVSGIILLIFEIKTSPKL